jgi:hypothetical protein
MSAPLDWLVGNDEDGWETIVVSDVSSAKCLRPRGRRWLRCTLFVMFVFSIAVGYCDDGQVHSLCYARAVEIAPHRAATVDGTYPVMCRLSILGTAVVLTAQEQRTLRPRTKRPRKMLAFPSFLR